MIKIDFEITDSSGLNTYRDALWLPEDHAYSDAEIEAIKQQRFERWLQVITTPVEVLPENIVELPIEGV